MLRLEHYYGYWSSVAESSRGNNGEDRESARLRPMINKDYILLLCLLCQLVPLTVSLAPGAATGSKVWACLVHLGSIGLAWFALSANLVIVPQLATVTLCFVMVVQYWALVALVRKFRARQGRLPRVNPFIPVRGMIADERNVSLAVLGLGVVPALMIARLAY
jgi:hypothetical protein